MVLIYKSWRINILQMVFLISARVEIFLISTRVEVFMELKKSLTRNEISTRAEFQLVFM